MQMEVIINHQIFLIRNSTLSGALHSYGLIQTKGVAVAVNDKVVPKSIWETFQLNPNDQITIITAAQGG